MDQVPCVEKRTNYIIHKKYIKQTLENIVETLCINSTRLVPHEMKENKNKNECG